jgi:4-amino-4-deoxy-L-arabinose transferase-like glycosyltransferase
MIVSHTRWKLSWIILLAFSMRFALRYYSGSADFWVNGYGFYFVLAQNFVPLVLFQSLIGAGTVLCAALLAREMFGSTAAITAAAITAFYPYYLIHDTALQETSLFTLLTAVAVLLLLRVRRNGSRGTAGCAGLMLGVAVMTRPTLAPFAILGSLWLAIPGVIRLGAWRQACWAAAICAGAMTLTLLPWIYGSYHLSGAGAVVSTTRAGYGLWIGNNPHTFSHYPYESIDRSTEAAFEALGPQEKAELEALGADGAAKDRWFRRRALGYITEHPGRTFVNGLQKIGASFDWLPSPRRSFWPNFIYFLSYGFVMIFGLWGLWLGRRHWREHSIFYALFISFAAVTALFWGHTSHRAYLDVYWIVFAAGALHKLQSRYFSRHQPMDQELIDPSRPADADCRPVAWSKAGKQFADLQALIPPG